ncbi:uncharacterized protein FIBRA_03328 [Fibroporia radiculosa]|uniref:Uncharacterized protein n=1 Tax=Fibroporia radiculosa TaxID=599839 RepID=J4H2C4_9APHY|nr:uncharacterized protein FIBRA_03328 [Fibroporia radiculosa]CCM01279.1 predicted protein [Fibroporia radiculosa]
MSSCYWPPAPLDSTLTVPWPGNITTFAEALDSLLPGIPDDLKPVDVTILDRCWCDISSNGFFEPYNVTEWERRSVLRVKESVEQKMEARRRELAAEESAHENSAEVVEDAAGSSDLEPSSPVDSNNGEPSAKLSMPSIREMMRSFMRTYTLNRDSESELAPSPNTTLEHPSSSSEVYHSQTNASSAPSPFPFLLGAPDEKLPLFRREYDLRPYGLALVLDFGWSSSDP